MQVEEGLAGAAGWRQVRSQGSWADRAPWGQGECWQREMSLIDLFIPTIDSEHGICYTQPEKLPGKTPIGRLLAQTYSFVYSSIFLFRRRPGEAITIWQLIKSETSDCNMPKMLWKCQLRTLKPVFDNTTGITLSSLSKHFFQRNSTSFKRGTRTWCKIQSDWGMHAMWHKTGNPLSVMVKGW